MLWPVLIMYFFVLLNNIACGMNGSQFVYPFNCGGHYGCFHIRAVIHEAALHIHIQIFA